MTTRTLFISLLIVCITSNYPLMALETPDLAQMERLIRAGKAEEAYNTMRPLQYDLAGNVEFDYLLGLAALESGHPDEATLAFERVLTVRPDMLGARLDMARAYFELGSLELAKGEFEELQKLDPPPEARQAMKRYMEAIEHRNTRLTYSAYIEGTIGYNSNVNSANSSNSPYIPYLEQTASLGSSSSKKS